MQFVDNAGSDQPAHNQGLHGLLTESMDTVVYIAKKKMFRSDCMDCMLIWTYAVCKMHKSSFHAMHYAEGTHIKEKSH